MWRRKGYKPLNINPVDDPNFYIFYGIPLSLWFFFNTRYLFNIHNAINVSMTSFLFLTFIHINVPFNHLNKHFFFRSDYIFNKVFKFHFYCFYVSFSNYLQQRQWNPNHDIFCIREVFWSFYRVCNNYNNTLQHYI